MLWKSLDGLWPKHGPRYPGLFRWTPHLDATRLKFGSFGYHLATDRAVGWNLGPDIYEAVPCDIHGAPVEGAHGAILVTCRTKLVRRTAWNRIRLSQTNARSICGKGVEALPIQLRWCWGIDTPPYLVDWVEGRAAGFVGHDTEESIDAWIRNQSSQRAALPMVRVRLGALIRALETEPA